VDIGHAAAAEQFTDLVAAGEQANVCRHPICHDPPLSRCCALLRPEFCLSQCNRARRRDLGVMP
jgi:hypothetical protein